MFKSIAKNLNSSFMATSESFFFTKSKRQSFEEKVSTSLLAAMKPPGENLFQFRMG